jgi:hypothetical protein
MNRRQYALCARRERIVREPPAHFQWLSLAGDPHHLASVDGCDEALETNAKHRL